MEFRILGHVTVIDDAGDVPLGPPRHHALLAALLLHPGAPLSVERLIGLLWGEAAPASAATIVHGSVAGLRRALEQRPGANRPRALVTHVGGYTLRVMPEQVDAMRFERLVAEGRRHVRDDPRRASPLLAQALSLWRGPALAGVDAPFVPDAAHRLEELRLDALVARADADLALGAHADLVGELETLVQQHPLRERLWAQLMVALYRCGRQAEALTAYRTARRLLGEQLGVLPGPELEDLQRAVLQHHPSLDPPGAARARPTLPRPLGVFVGRERERDRLAALLDGQRLVTLVGAAGIGKSRLAIEVARSMTQRFPAGIWFVDLALLTTAELVPQAVADALGVRAEPGVRLLDTVTGALARRRALLILDNCEHLLHACGRLANAVVTASTQPRVLATSRERLGLPSETILPLSPLPVPGPDTTWERAAASPAVWLFGARAATARPDFRVTEANVGLVRDICHRLDGMPLAIELAASRVAALPLHHIVDRLDHQHRLLDARSEDFPDRHRGLDTAVRWSYDLLTEPEQLLFERLSVFAGGFTLDAAEVIAGDARLPRRSVAALLSGLVSRSLVQLEQIAAERSRYRMLEPLREYARARLAHRGEAAATAERHARHHLAWIEQAERYLYQAGSMPWLERIRAENENLRAALRWAFGPDGDARLGARMAALLWHPWDLAGARTEGLHWIDAGLRGVSASEPELRMPLLAAATLLRLGLGEIDTAHALAAEQLRLAHGRADRRWEGDALTRMGMIAWTRGDLPAATAHLEQAVDALRAAKDRWREAIALAHLARVQRDTPQLPAAQSTAEAALVVARLVGEDTALGFALDILGSILRQRGRPDRAGAPVEEALARYRAIGYREGEASALQATGGLLLDRGDRDAAGQAFRSALELCMRLGHRGGIAASLDGLAQISLTNGDDVRAAVLFGAAAAQRDLLGGAAPTAKRQAQETVQGRLLASLGAEELQQATRRGADADLEDLVKAQGPAAVGAATPTQPPSRPAAPTIVYIASADVTSMAELLDEAAVDTLTRWLDRTLRSICGEHGAAEISREGEVYLASFADAADALNCACGIQRDLADHRRNHGFAPRVRIAVHTAGSPERAGAATRVATRIGAVAGNGEVLATRAALEAATDAFTASALRPIEPARLTGPVEVAAIDWY
ncbi:BTAD domain-containing putative transcriptional regulator [Dactylosporangium sp. NPDC048998]|uniref:BTAD domain-containing putative transcriptional regulator n=1 Tax=Dactylosporangium sp. NPDC048998 TaxID=3363976 RepID=UPI00371569A6